MPCRTYPDREARPRHDQTGRGRELAGPVIRRNLLAGKGPPHSTRLMVSLHQYTYNLSAVRVLDAWVENPHRQYLSGKKWRAHELPIHRRRWRPWPQRRLARNASDPDRSVKVGEKLAGQIADG